MQSNCAQIRRNKFAYFLNFWNILDVILILLSLLCIAFDIYRSQAVASKLGQLLQNDQQFMDFDFLSYWQVQFNNAVAWALFIAYIKVLSFFLLLSSFFFFFFLLLLPSSVFNLTLSSTSSGARPRVARSISIPLYECVHYTVQLMVSFASQVFKYVSFSKTMSQLQVTLGACARDLAGFSIMFGIVFVAFAQLGYLAFGTQVAGFSSIGQSLYARVTYSTVLVHCTTLYLLGSTFWTDRTFSYLSGAAQYMHCLLTRILHLQFTLPVLTEGSRCSALCSATSTSTSWSARTA